jgi:hypothetical protein
MLDVRFNNKIDSNLILIYNEIAYNFRSEFNEIIKFYSKYNLNNIDWWVEGPASRNTLASPLFHNLTVLLFLDYLLKNNLLKSKLIIVDNIVMKKIIMQILHNNNDNKIKVLSKNKRSLFKTICIHFYLIFFKLIQFISIKILSIIIKKNNKSINIILVDTFMNLQNVLKNRWYYEFYNSVENKENIYFVPTIINTKFYQIPILYYKLLKLKTNFIFKENHLYFKDIIYCFTHYYRLSNIILKDYNLRDTKINISNIVKFELYNNSDLSTVYESLFTYRFIKNISKEKLPVSQSIDWYEGHSIDKAWNLGFNKYFPQINNIGYRPFWTLPYYLCSYPISIESQANVLPKYITVFGQGLVNEISEYLPTLNTIIVPSYRSNYVYKINPTIFQDTINDRNHKILVTLPISLESTISIINLLINYNNSINNFTINFILKLHPSVSYSKELRSLLNNLPENISITDLNIEILIHDVKILITEGSSSCIEALACNRKVIIIQNNNGLFINPIPRGVNKNIYKLVKTSTELCTAIFDLLSEQTYNFSEEIKEKYFTEINEKNKNNIFNFTTKK